MVSCLHLLQRYEGLLVSNILLVVGSQRPPQGAGGAMEYTCLTWISISMAVTAWISIQPTLALLACDVFLIAIAANK